MHFVAAFCDVIVAETKRLEVLGSDKAKSDFISSVSHELRSPLHGILGSAEILAEYQLDNTASTLVEQINSCGHSLLQIIDHLLDFANLKKQQMEKDAANSSKISRKFLPTTASASAAHDLAALNIGVALDELTEEVVVSSAYSFYYSQGVRDRTNVPVILDIDHFADTGWRCDILTGAWKRICMNLVTNALKYTLVGYICVSLKQTTRPGSQRGTNAVLSVTDSGKGMSREFQKNHLFRDFSQEDTLSSGLGLGMHMVSRMVHAMGGKIDVISDQDGAGTHVTVIVPLELTRNGYDHRRHAKRSGTAAFKVDEGLKIELITELNPSPSTQEDSLLAATSAMAIASIESNCSYLGAQLERCIWKARSPCDLKIVMEADLSACLQSMRDTREGDDREVFTPMLIVCNSSPSAQTLRELWMSDILNSCVIIEHIALPCAIKQLSRAIGSVLRLQKELLRVAAAETRGRKASSVQRLADGDRRSHSICAKDQWTEQTSQLKASREGVTGMPLPPPSLPLQDVQLSSREHTPSILKLTCLPSSHASMLPDQGSLETQLPKPPSTETIVSALLPTLNTKRLLLVDDNEINLRLLATFAKKRNYPHITAINGKLAVCAFQAAHEDSCASPGSEVGFAGACVVGIPNVILMDINMPVMDGYEAVQHIRTYERKHHMTPAKIIAVTALQSEAAHTEAFGSGFDMFLSKPIKLEGLTKLIEE
jgi:signal transduction histidine kinase/CheY-like chemotaxis protein